MTTSTLPNHAPEGKVASSRYRIIALDPNGGPDLVLASGSRAALLRLPALKLLHSGRYIIRPERLGPSGWHPLAEPQL